MSTVSSFSDGAIEVRIEAQGQFFRAKVLDPNNHGVEGQRGGKRGKVTVFSAASRKRCLEITARLQFDQEARPWFFTLTYPNENDCPGGKMPSPLVAKEHLEAFRKRMQRRFPKFAAIWRIEIQEKRFQRYGVVAPHFHLIVFGLPYFAKCELKPFFSWVQEQWGEATGTAAAKPFTRCERMQSWKGVMSYVAKYVAKRTRPMIDSAGSTIMHIPPPEGWIVGRHWGIFNRVLLPWALLSSCSMFLGKWFYRLRRLARHVYRNVVTGKYQGFSLFRADPYRWLDLTEELEAGIVGVRG